MEWQRQALHLQDWRQFSSGILSGHVSLIGVQAKVLLIARGTPPVALLLFRDAGVGWLARYPGVYDEMAMSYGVEKEMRFC